MKNYYYVILTENSYFQKFTTHGLVCFSDHLSSARTYETRAITKDFIKLSEIGYHPKLKKVFILSGNISVYNTFSK